MTIVALCFGVGSIAFVIVPFLFCQAIPKASVGLLLSLIALFQWKNPILAILAAMMNGAALTVSLILHAAILQFLQNTILR